MMWAGATEPQGGQPLERRKGGQAATREVCREREPLGGEGAKPLVSLFVVTSGMLPVNTGGDPTPPDAPENGC